MIAEIYGIPTANFIVFVGLVAIAIAVLVYLTHRPLGRYGDPDTAQITIDDLAITRLRKDGEVDVVRWSDVESLRLLTLRAGPRRVRHLFEVVSAAGPMLRLPGDREHATQLLEQTYQLPGFNHRRVIGQLDSTTPGRVECWSR